MVDTANSPIPDLAFNNDISQLVGQLNLTIRQINAQLQAIGGGEIVGNVGSVDNAIVTANGTGGSTIQGSTPTVNDSGDIAFGTLSGRILFQDGGAVVFPDGATHTLQISAYTANALGIKNNSSGQDMLLVVSSSDADGTDSAGLFVIGFAGDNGHNMVVGYSADATSYVVAVAKGDTGAHKPIIFQASDNQQIVLNIDGTVSLSSVGFLANTRAGLTLNNLTTAQRGALTPVNGNLIYNTSTNTAQLYANGAWNDLDMTPV